MHTSFPPERQCLSIVQHSTGHRPLPVQTVLNCLAKKVAISRRKSKIDLQTEPWMTNSGKWSLGPSGVPILSLDSSASPACTSKINHYWILTRYFYPVKVRFLHIPRFRIQDVSYNQCVCSECWGALVRTSLRGQGTCPPSAGNRGYTVAALSGHSPGLWSSAKATGPPRGCPYPTTDQRGGSKAQLIAST